MDRDPRAPPFALSPCHARKRPSLGNDRVCYIENLSPQQSQVAGMSCGISPYLRQILFQNSSKENSVPLRLWGTASSGIIGPMALSSLVLLDMYWTHKWYIYIFPIIDQLTFSAAPPFFPVPRNNLLTIFKLVRTNATGLWVGGINNYLNTCIICQLVFWDIK